MTVTRREFLQTSAAVTAAGLLAPQRLMAGRASGPLKILILGGTGFLGPATIDAAKARGHTLTLFNRGRTEKRKGGLYPELDKVYGNRDPDRRADESKDPNTGQWKIEHPEDTSIPKGLEALKGRSWDVVIDNSGYFPRHTKASAELLAPNAKQYIFISTVSVYAAHGTPDADESDGLGTLADPTVESMGAQSENYGPLKVLCEESVRSAFKERACVVRPGFIVGPGDPTDRFTYWPVRFDKGGEVLVPGQPEDPVQVIDVRDLGEWLIHLAENNINGTFNAVGLGKPATAGELAASCVRASSASPAPTATHVPWDFLQAQEVGGLPITIPPAGEYAGFHRRSNAAAVKSGLKFRTLDDTVAATLGWFKSQPADRQSKMPPWLTAEREKAVLEAWKTSKK